MSIFGRTDNDLHLLRLPPADLKTADWHAVRTQLDHHCIRLAWREHARTKAPVRDLLRLAIGAAHIRLNEVSPDDEFDDELLSLFIDEAVRENEFRVCLGFLLDDEARAVCRAAIVGPFPPPYSIFAGRTWLLAPYVPAAPTRLHLARAALQKLRELWKEYRHRAATDPLARETVRIVAAATGKDPQLSECLVLDSRLALMQSWIAESKASALPL